MSAHIAQQSDQTPTDPATKPVTLIKEIPMADQTTDQLPAQAAPVADTVEETPIATNPAVSIPATYAPHGHNVVAPVFNMPGCHCPTTPVIDTHHVRRVRGGNEGSWTEPRVLIAFVIGFLLAFALSTQIFPDQAFIEYVLAGVIGGGAFGIVAEKTDVLR